MKKLNSMKLYQINTAILIFLIFSSFFTACNKENPETEFEVFADAYTVKKLVDDEPKTAIAFYAYGNKNISEAKVTPPEGEGSSVQLAASDGSGYTFYKEPEPEDFKSESPAEEIYVFDVESTSGEVVQETDLLEIVNPEIPEIVSTSFNTNTLTLTVKWEAITGADGTAVKLTDKQGNTIFISYGLSSTTTEFPLGTESGTWTSSANLGDELILQVQAYVVEGDVNEELSLYNIAGIAIGEKEIIWGQ
jgi:hypothetical protein